VPLTRKPPAPPADIDSVPGVSSVSRSLPSDEEVAELVRAHDPLVRAALRRVLGRHRDEDDLVQEVFLRLAIRMRQPGAVVPAAWLRRVARNVAIDELRRRRPVPVVDTLLDDATPPLPDHVGCRLEAEQLHDVLRRAVASLPERQRAALARRVAGSLAEDCGDPAQEGAGSETDGAAKVLDRSSEARYSLVARARRQLRGQLAEEWPLAAIGGVPAVRWLGDSGRARRTVRRARRWTLRPTGAGPHARAALGWMVRGVVVAGSAAGLALGAATWAPSGSPATPLAPPVGAGRQATRVAEGAGQAVGPAHPAAAPVGTGWSSGQTPTEAIGSVGSAALRAGEPAGIDSLPDALGAIGDVPGTLATVVGGTGTIGTVVGGTGTIGTVVGGTGTIGTVVGGTGTIDTVKATTRATMAVTAVMPSLDTAAVTTGPVRSAAGTGLP